MKVARSYKQSFRTSMEYPVAAVTFGLFQIYVLSSLTDTPLAWGLKKFLLLSASSKMLMAMRLAQAAS